MTLSIPNARLLDTLVPFVVATGTVQARLDLSPFGLSIASEHVFNPLRTATSRLLRRLSALDGATFGPEGMPMAHWIFLDGAGLTGAIVGFARDASEVPKSVAELLGIGEHDEGLVPYAMYIAIPSFEGDTWVGHNLGSLAVRKPEGENLAGLGSLTKAVGLKVMRARYQLGAAQWGASALRVHTRLGPLELLSAWTPAHTKPWTFTYRASLDDACLRHLARDPGGRAERLSPDRYIAADSHAEMQALQHDLEAGQRWCIAGPPETDEQGKTRVPLARLSAPPVD